MEAPGGRAVAIIDDDEAVRDSLKMLLELAGHRVLTYASAGDFLAAEETSCGCLIVDHFMPNMSGLELISRLRPEPESRRVLLITGTPSLAVVERARLLGVARILEKPHIRDDVLAFVDDCLGNPSRQPRAVRTGAGRE